MVRNNFELKNILTIVFFLRLEHAGVPGDGHPSHDLRSHPSRPR
jgi:hypothetical protein